MSQPITVLLLFVGLTALLPLIYAGMYRVPLVFSGKTGANSWTRGNEKWRNAAVIQRMQDAHMNCMENLPLYIGVVAAAYATNQLEVIGWLAWVYLGLRIAQVAVHLVGTSKTLVFLRATCFLLQLLLIFYWIIALLV